MTFCLHNWVENRTFAVFDTDIYEAEDRPNIVSHLYVFDRLRWPRLDALREFRN